jgi:SAM-dependent methyltransferase
MSSDANQQLRGATQHAPATVRNRAAIYDVLQRVLPTQGLILEIASGTGEHATWIAPQLLTTVWQPTDRDPAMRESIAAWTEERAAINVLPPLVLDVCEAVWPVTAVAAIFCANMIHISPWEATEGLMRGAGRVLSRGGVLVLYGPFMIDQAHTAPSNEAFDASLRERNPAWGVRDLGVVAEVARKQGLQLRERIEMPANNLGVVFERG